MYWMVLLVGLQAHPVEGVWVSPAWEPDNPAARIEDFVHGAGVIEKYLFLVEAVYSTDTPLEELEAEARQLHREVIDSLHLTTDITPFPDPAVECAPPGLTSRIMAIPGIEISVRGNAVSIVSEFDRRPRVIPLGEPRAATEPLPLGTSWAWVEGEDLVVETTGIERMYLAPGYWTGPDLRIIERYHPEGDWIGVTMTLIDPSLFNRPRVVFRPRVRSQYPFTPSELECELVSGEFEEEFIQ